MLSDIHLGFLKDRINEIGSALFFNNGTATFKLPTTSIISALKVDDRGNIWFFLHKPETFISETDKIFPAKMDFYRKGKPFFLQVKGQANLITEEDAIEALVDMAPAVKDRAIGKVMLVKVQIEHVEYYEQLKRTIGRLESWWVKLCSRLFQAKPSVRQYEMNPIVLS